MLTRKEVSRKIIIKRKELGALARKFMAEGLSKEVVIDIQEIRDLAREISELKEIKKSLN